MNNDATSSSVSVPPAQTSPGTFSIDLTGTGDGAIVHLNGIAPGAVDNATTPVAVFINGIPASTSPPFYSGINPSYLSGEFPVAVETPEAFNDRINLAVQ